MVDLLINKRSYSYWALNKGYAFLPHIKKNKNYKKVSIDEGQEILIPYLVNTKEIKPSDQFDLEPIEVNAFYELVSTSITNLLKENHPKTTYWKYDEKNLLPSAIPLENFATNPNTCIPLKNLFHLAGIKNITEQINKAKQGSTTKLRNLLERVSDHANRHFHETWKEYSSISFSLVPNGLNIDSGIKERNTYTMQQRSDGFKRFMSFLLKVSADNKNQELVNSLILIDEPDISLHPSGIRYLRDELKNISKNNLVLASTHSIFMIDEDCIKRHYIVTKENEKTILEVPDEDNIVNEEVLYKAMGYSIYEQLAKTNILFEGWKDKKLFMTALERVPANYKEIKDKFKNVGLSHSFGVKSIKNIAPIFEFTNRRLMILSDSDKPALEKQKEFLKQKLYGKWLSFSDVDINLTQITAEDFLKTEFLKKGITETKKNNSNLNNEPDYTNLKNGILANIGLWIMANGVTTEQKGELLEKFKDWLFENLKSSDIVEEYYVFLLGVSKLIED